MRGLLRPGIFEGALLDQLHFLFADELVLVVLVATHVLDDRVVDPVEKRCELVVFILGPAIGRGCNSSMCPTAGPSLLRRGARC
jgi:hypothetical protein